MRSFVWLSVLGLAAAGPSMVEQGHCLVDSGEAVSDATDAALFVWAASKRCGNAGQEVKCEIDVSSAVKAANSMINVILKAVDKCHDLHTANKKMGMQVGQMTEHIAALSAAAGQVYQKCPAVAQPNAGGLQALASPVMCTIDLKNTAKGLFKATKKLTETHHECKKGQEDCASNVLNVVGALAGMGQFLAGSVGQCKRTTAVNPAAAAGNIDTRPSLFAQAAAALLEYTTKVSQDGLVLADLGKEKEEEEPPAGAFGPGGVGGPAPAPIITEVVEEQVPRLFEQDGKKAAGTSSMNLVLGAFLPITAIVSFVGGRFYANHRSRTEQTREFMSDHE